MLSLIVGGIALAIGYAMEVKKMRRPSDEWLEDWEDAAERGSLTADAEEIVDEDIDGHGGVSAGNGAGPGGPGGVSGAGERELVSVGPAVGRVSAPVQPESEARIVGHGMALRGTPAGEPVPAEAHTIVAVDKPFAAKFFAIFVPLTYLALIVYLVVASVSDSVPDLQGGDAAALVGGIAVLTMFGAAFARNQSTFMETSAEHIVDGLVFAFKAMGVVLPIAGFFFLGNGEFAGQIMSLGEGVTAPAFLYELVVAGQEQIPTAAWSPPSAS